MSARLEEGADIDRLCPAGWGACQGRPAHAGLGFLQNDLGFLTLPCAQVPYKLIDVGAPFSAAFLRISGWHWVAYLVSVGAVFGLGTVRTCRYSFIHCGLHTASRQLGTSQHAGGHSPCAAALLSIAGILSGCLLGFLGSLERGFWVWFWGVVQRLWC